MTKSIQPPRPIEEMSTEELKAWEDRLARADDLSSEDVWDSLEHLRKLLNDSHIEAMHFLKKQSIHGRDCPYYVKAKILFDRDQRANILSLLDKINKDLEEENS